MKRCCTCKEWKPFERFAKHKGRVDGYADQCKDCRHAYNVQHRDKIRAKGAAYYHTHKDQMLATSRIWHATNKDVVNAIHVTSNNKRRAAKYANGPVESIDLETLFKRDKGICGICKEECTMNEGSIDHIVPISKGGAHTWNNVQLAHLPCNIRKGNRGNDAGH